VPIYEYLCHDCSYKFELKQSMKDEAIAACDRCGKKVSRIISAPAIMFKGSGWYVTDYSDKMKPPAGETSGSAPTPKKEASADSAATAAAPATTSTSAPTSTTPAASSGTGGSSTTSSSSSSTTGGTSSST
jgi:putative FmdB family regulatory protein